MLLNCTLNQLMMLDGSYRSVNADVDANSVLLPLTVKDGAKVARKINQLKNGALLTLRPEGTLHSLFFRYYATRSATYNSTTDTLHVPVYGEPKRQYIPSKIPQQATYATL